MRLLCGVGLVVHEEEFEITGVVDQESLVAGWHHVACLSVRAVTDLEAKKPVSLPFTSFPQGPHISHLLLPFDSHLLSSAYLWHSSLTLESSPDSVVDTLRLSPARVNAFESVGLVTVEARGACVQNLVSALDLQP